MERGIKDHKKICALKGIESYVMVILSAHPDFREHEINSTALGLAQIRGELPDLDELRKSMPEHKYILYFAHQQLTEMTYRRLLAKFPAALEEVPDKADPEEMIYWLHLAINDADPRPKRDYYESGSPAKFGTKLLVDEQWHVKQIIRHGSFARNALLTDSQIIADLSGEQGVTRQNYAKTFRTDDPGQISVIRDDVKHCLRDNPAWKNQILRVLEEISEMASDEDAQISIVNPNNMLLATYLVHKTGLEGQGYIPNYFITVGQENELICFYTGVIRQVGNPPSLSNLIAHHFGNSEAKAVYSLLWGGYEENDAAIMRDMGLSYQTVKVQFTAAGQMCEELVDYGWKAIDEIENPLSYFYRFLETNPAFVREVTRMYSSRWNGFMADFSPQQEGRSSPSPSSETV